MADNVAITAGTGTSVATDDIGGVHYQRNKLALGADGAAADAVGGAGAVSAAVQRVTLASDDPAVTLLTGMDVDTDAIKTSVQLIDNLVLAEDAASASGDPGIQILAVRKATPTNSSGTDGDYEPLQMNGGRLWASVVLDTAIPAGTNNIGDVDIATITAGETHVGEVSVPYDTVSVTPTVSTTPAYTSGDAVGGKQTITSACRISGGDTLLQSLTVIDKANQKQPLTLLFFDADPSAATITDNSAFAFSTDVAKLIGKINVLAADYETVNSIGIAALANLGLLLKASGSANIFVAVVTTGTPQFAATSDLIFRYSFAQG